MAVMTAMTLAGIAVESDTDWIKLVAYGIVFLILWVPSIVLMVLLPRLRAGTATVFTMFGIFSASPVGLDLGPYTWLITFVCYLAVFFIAARITIPMRLTGTVLIDRPREEVARIVRLRPKGQTWQRNVERIEPHPDDPELLRAFLAPPISKHIPFFDVRILSDDGMGNQHWQATSDHKAWRGSECGMAMEDVGGRTLVTYAERSLLPVLGWLVAWLDDIGMDAMHELKFYVEGQPNWTIRAGDGRWWPSWSAPPDASVF